MRVRSAIRCARWLKRPQKLPPRKPQPDSASAIHGHIRSPQNKLETRSGFHHEDDANSNCQREGIHTASMFDYASTNLSASAYRD